MKNLIIIGAGGFGREVAWLVERINKVEMTWNLLGFLDDTPEKQNKSINGYRVLGTTADVSKYDAYYVCAVGAASARESIITRITKAESGIRFATLIDPSVDISKLVNIGDGSIICAQCILTVNIKIGKYVIINLDCTIGHDAILEDYVTLYPSVNVSGTTKIGRCSELGTGTQIIQGKTVGKNTIIGSGAVIVNNIPDKCTAVGVPARPIKFL